MKLLVTGANGQLGIDLVRILSNKHEVHGFGRDGLDIRNLEQCLVAAKRLEPDAIIHLAAFTAVDRAEMDEDEAYLVNAIGTRNIALSAQEVGAKLCYLSTDYVFDGTSLTPYKEYDNTNPISVYGKTKRAGEYLVSTLCSKYFIVRTSWVYGQHGNNFVKTILRLAQEKEKIKVVNDQIGSPTYTVDLSEFLENLIITQKYGIYHASNSGSCSWYDFANAIVDLSRMKIRIESCTTEEFPRPAPRPKFSVMDHVSMRANGFEEMRHWNEALVDFFKKNGMSQ